MKAKMSMANANESKSVTREVRALEMVLSNCDINKLSANVFLVRSQSSNKYYEVKKGRLEWTCECQDYLRRRAICKHILAVKLKTGSKNVSIEKWL
ncbi:MAG: SWIM zinc finger family protein [Nitrososphaerales archaeon]